MQFLELIPGLGTRPHGALQIFAFWLLLVLVPLFSLISVLGVRIIVEQRFRALSRTFPDLAGTTFMKLFEAGKVKISRIDYALPLLFLLLVNAFMSVILVSGSVSRDGLVDAEHYVMLCGPRCAEATVDVPPESLLDFRRYQTGTLVVLGYAFLGWVCWALVTIFDRSTSLQILPTTFRKITIRLALAVLVAVALRHIFQAGTDVANFSLVLLGFGAGMFPQRGVAYVEQLFNRLVQASERSEEFGLELLQGVSRSLVFRLEELGIDDALDLAHANPFTLYDSTGFSMSEILDWIGQAQLLVVTQSEGFKTLQAAGLRTVFDVVKLLRANPPGPLPALPGGLETGGLTLGQIASRAEYTRLEEVYRAIGSTV